MNDAVLVRSSLRSWDFILLLISAGALLILAGLLALGGEEVVATVLAAASAAALLTSILGWRRRIRLRQWVRDTGAGFVVSDSSGERTIEDDQVLSMALIYANNYSQGLLTSVTRRF